MTYCVSCRASLWLMAAAYNFLKQVFAFEDPYIQINCHFDYK